MFNDYFESVFGFNSDHELLKGEKHGLNQLTNSQDQVTEVMAKLDINKSTDPDKIGKYLKQQPAYTYIQSRE